MTVPLIDDYEYLATAATIYRAGNENVAAPITGFGPNGSEVAANFTDTASPLMDDREYPVLVRVLARHDTPDTIAGLVRFVAVNVVAPRATQVFIRCAEHEFLLDDFDTSRPSEPVMVFSTDERCAHDASWPIVIRILPGNDPEQVRRWLEDVAGAIDPTEPEEPFDVDGWDLPVFPDMVR